MLTALGGWLGKPSKLVRCLAWLNHSSRPRVQACCIFIVDTAGPNGEGPTSRANRVASGPHWDAGQVGYSNPAVRARMMAWARSET
jgi:hypothetical protein